MTYTKLGDFIVKNAKIWEILTKWVRFWLLFTKTLFYQNDAGTDLFFKYQARKLKFGPGVPLYGV